MKGRETKGAPAAADLLVCFPSRAHLTLMPKPICSPARGSNGQASPVLWAKPKSSTGTELVSEPTSPKVTCAGQIKVRHKTSNCKSWQSVMEEIERMHNSRKQKKARPGWSEALGIKKDEEQSNNNGFSKDDRMMKIEEEEDEKGSTGCEVAVPPANALMLMRCSKNSLKCLMEAENNELVVMRYDTDFYKISSDIAKETWVVGGIRDPFSRSRSWKR
uniref:Uncharacterized protein n=1 Tax=Cannabis sativa TaxID=3483 RepID=A0A803NLU7_CANSA